MAVQAGSEERAGWEVGVYELVSVDRRPQEQAQLVEPVLGLGTAASDVLTPC